MVFFIVLYVRVLVHIALAIKKKGKAVLIG